MSTYDTKTKRWDAPQATHDDLRAISKGGMITTTSEGIIIFEKDLSPEEKLQVENLLNTKRL